MNIQAYHSSSRGNLYRVDNILIDPGVPIAQIKKYLDYRLCDIAGCLCSHAHSDHSQGIKDLLKCGVDCYMSEQTRQSLNLNGHRVHSIEPERQFRLGHFTILPFTLVHDSPNMGFLLISDRGSKLLYSTDTQYIPYRFRGLTHIMIEVNYELEILKSNLKSGALALEVAKSVIHNHMSLETAKEFFRVNDMSAVREIHLLHLSNKNSNAGLFRDEIQSITGRPVFIGG